MGYGLASFCSLVTTLPPVLQGLMDSNGKEGKRCGLPFPRWVKLLADFHSQVTWGWRGGLGTVLLRSEPFSKMDSGEIQETPLGTVALPARSPYFLSWVSTLKE